MKLRMKLHGLVGSALVVLVVLGVVACAQSETDIAGGEDDRGGTETGSSSTLPPPSNPPRDSDAGSSSSGSSSGGGSTKPDSGAQSSSSGGSGSGSGGVPACSFGGDFVKLIAKAAEIQAGLPCDASCNPATHCCLDLLGGAGGSSGLPLDDAGLGGGAGLPGGACVSND